MGNVKTYSGVGQIDGKRAQISLKRVLKENTGFSHVGSKTKIMANRKQAYMLEDMLIQGNGGAGNKFRNFNKINSPGRKLLKWLIKAR